ncbi:DUF917 domain-containing protein [Vulcanisaeta thermophila]|uniref:DUF917 domain-containing protein n=1 Tax=Vulcanisaeta thermophila TaxID=867917 RepID=UPI0008531C6C|nr:DUF917 domain-containing protein [Vulcanisaeta thermophila]
MRVIESIEEAEDLVIGATVLGTGGGGNPDDGLEIIKKVLNARRQIRIVDITETSSTDLFAVPYYVGTVAPVSTLRKPVKIGDPILTAYNEYTKVLNGDIMAFVATEMGGGNTPVAIYIASMLGKPVIDGDMIGRAAPELHQSTANILGIPLCPSVVVTETGNIVIIKQYSDLDDYESIARYISVLAGKHAIVIDTPMTKQQAEQAIVRGTLSLALKLGRSIREARKVGGDVALITAKVLRGWVVFRGVIDNYDWKNEGGFLIGNLIIRGVNKWSGLTFRSWIKNEHIMAFINEKPIVMPPDLIIVMNNYGPVTNDKLRVGDEVAVVAAPAPSIWRSERGLELFGPRHFGFNYDYKPVEELVRSYGVVEHG